MSNITSETSCGPILQHLFFDIAPNLLPLRTFLQSNRNKKATNGKTNN